MNIGDLFRVLGGATVAGLGTAEEQRQRQDKATQVAMVVEHQRRQEEAAQIRHLQDLLERASYHRGLLAAKPPEKPEGLWDPRTLAPVGEALPSAPLPILTPAVPATPAISDENRLNYPATPAVPEVRAMRGSPGDVAALLRARIEQARERIAPIPHIPNLSLVPDPNAPGGFRQVGTPVMGENLVDTGEGFATKEDVIKRLKAGQKVTSAGSVARGEAQLTREDAAKEREQTNIDRQLSTWANNYRNDMESVYGALGPFAGVPPIPEAWYNALKMPDRVYEAKYGTKQRPDKKQMALMRAQQLGQFFKKGQVAQGTLRKQDQGRIEQILQMEGLPLE